MRNVPGRPLVPRLESFTITGIFSTGYQELDSLWVYISYEKGLRVLDPASSQQLIGIKIDEPFRNAALRAAEIDEVLPVDFRTYTWYDLEKSQYKSFQTTRVLLLFIMILIVCVAAVNISSSLVMLVIEKRQEIGILKSIGASPRGIMTVFLVTGFCIGVLGTALGLTTGLLTAVNINELLKIMETIMNGTLDIVRFLISPFVPYEKADIRILNPAFYLETIPVRLDVIALFGIGCFTVFLATIASLIPARNAGGIRPLDVLRKH